MVCTRARLISIESHQKSVNRAFYAVSNVDLLLDRSLFLIEKPCQSSAISSLM